MSDLDLNRRLERIEAALLRVPALEKAFGEKAPSMCDAPMSMLTKGIAAAFTAFRGVGPVPVSYPSRFRPILERARGIILRSACLMSR